MEKIFVVYALINDKNEIEYIGQTSNPKNRIRRHINNKPNLNNTCSFGHFYKRTDIKMEILASFNNRKEAKKYEETLQKQYGFLTEYEKGWITKHNKTEEERKKTSEKLANSQRNYIANMPIDKKIERYKKAVETRKKNYDKL